MLRVVIVGTGEMASSLLLGVREAGHKVVGIFRHERVKKNIFARCFRDLFAPSDFFLIANRYKIPEIKAKSVNSPEFRKALIRLNADIVLVGSWGEKFSKKTINTPKFGTINCHPSLLPTHRGPNPYMSTISTGEEKTGVTFHFMDENYDTGNILLQKEVPILFSDNGYTLKLRCTKAARNALSELLPALECGTVSSIEQNPDNASYFKRISNKDIYINFTMSPFEIYNKVRGFEPWAFCYIKAKNSFLRIGHAQVINLLGNEFFVKNQKYRIPDRYINAKAGKIIAKGNDWLLCTTIDKDHAILLFDLKLYGFCKQFLTKQFLATLKSLK